LYLVSLGDRQLIRCSGATTLLLFIKLLHGTVSNIMSKVVVYVLDKIVWMLLITAVTTQALQIAGVVDTPKGLGDISYKQDNEYSFQVQVGETDVRGKRQTDQRAQFIDSLFNKQFGQGEYFFRINRTKVITAKM
jgi:hypothetical protein